VKLAAVRHRDFVTPDLSRSKRSTGALMANAGNSVLEFMAVPLILLPMLLVLARAVVIERTEIQASAAGRDLQRCVALAGPLTQTQLQSVAIALLRDNEVGGTTKVEARPNGTGWSVQMSVMVAGLVPGSKATVTQKVDLE
jgi:hypothetical protein